MKLPSADPPAKPLTGPQKALRKLGLVRPIDLALHLPLRCATRMKPASSN
jgi:ATP-dependent DNA helicase RecG